MNIEFFFYKILKMIQRLKINGIRLLISIVIDTSILIFSVLITNFLVGNNFNLNLSKFIIVLISTGISLYILSGQYRFVLKFTSKKLFYDLTYLNFLLIIFVYLIDFYSFKYFGPLSNFIFLYLVLTFISTFVKYNIVDFLNLIKRDRRKNGVIYGAGEAGGSLANSLYFNNKYKILAFIDDNKTSWGRSINKIPIKKPQDFFLNQNNVDF